MADSILFISKDEPVNIPNAVHNSVLSGCRLVQDELLQFQPNASHTILDQSSLRLVAKSLLELVQALVHMLHYV